MKILALDFGTKRIGVAVSDPLNITAQGRMTIVRQSIDKDIHQICELVAADQVSRIVIGLPLNMNGTRGPMVDAVEAFADKVRQKIDIEIVFWDERMTSSMADKSMLESSYRRERRKAGSDRIAAILILQSYLDFLEQTAGRKEE